MQMSMFKPYSVGIAAENKKLSSKELEVVPIEIVMMVDGELTSNFTELLDRGRDGADIEYSVKVSGSNALKATWLPFGSNRTTPPDIRRGERVQLYRAADCDKFYWKEMGLDDNLRTLETVIFAFSNSRNPDKAELNPDNSYYVEVSTHTKQITIKTNKSDGEPFAYTVQLNTKEGAFTVTDDDGNFYQMDSAERRHRMMNRDKAEFDMHKKNLLITIPELIRMKCKNWDVEATDSITFKTKAWSATATTSITYTSPLFDGKLDATKLSGTLEVTGATTLLSTLGVVGFASLAGGFGLVPVLGGTPTITGNSTGISSSVGFNFVGATITIDNIDIGPLHTHGYTSPGGPDQTDPVTP